MVRSTDRLRALASLLVIGVLAAACAGDNRGETSDSDPAARLDQQADGDAGIDAIDRCDLGFNTAAFNDANTLVHHVEDDRGRPAVDFTLEEWAEVFVDERLGMTVEDVLAALTPADDIYRRHILGGALTHTLDPDPWMPMTDQGQCVALAGELREARAAAARYPTVADAVADGYTLGDFYNAGMGVHFQNWDLLGPFDPRRPTQLLFDGAEDDATLVGLSYVMTGYSVEPPEGFVGDNDHWHRHRSWCLDVANGAVNLGADVVGEQECVRMGGTYVLNTDAWMLHLWVVPGCESDWGLFSGANPRVPYMPEGAAFLSGCNSGKTLADPIDLDRAARGPEIAQ